MTPPVPACEPFPGSRNRHGEVEKIGDVGVTHWFVEVVRARYHVVTAGDPEAPPLVMLHGLPESWWAFHNQIRDLSDAFFVIAPDLKGYGQSEKRLDLSYQFPHCAFEMALLLEKLGVGRFFLATHDRGSVLGDHLANVPGFDQRIRKYARMQQRDPGVEQPMNASCAGTPSRAHRTGSSGARRASSCS